MPQFRAILIWVIDMHPDVLNSWKEIASYLGRGVRTAQRWEAELRLPVHRPRQRKRSAVTALKSELDQWVRNTGRPENGNGNGNGNGKLVSFADVAQTAEILLRNRQNMRTLSIRLCEQIRQTRLLLRQAHEITSKRESIK
jgi:hypothetical protein